MRLKPMVALYQGRLPKNKWRYILLKICLLLVTVASSVLARLELSQWVAVVTSASSVFTSWSEFIDSGRKMERYNRVLVDIENLLTWWKSLSHIDKASVANT